MDVKHPAILEFLVLFLRERVGRVLGDPQQRPEDVDRSAERRHMKCRPLVLLDAIHVHSNGILHYLKREVERGRRGGRDKEGEETKDKEGTLCESDLRIKYFFVL